MLLVIWGFCLKSTHSGDKAVFRNFNLSESITAFFKRLKMFVAPNDVAEEKQEPVLLSVIGMKTYSLLRSLLAPKAPKGETFVNLECVEVAFQSPVVSYCRTFPLLPMKSDSCWIAFSLCGRGGTAVHDTRFWQVPQQRLLWLIYVWPLNWNYTATIAVKDKIDVDHNLGNSARHGGSWLWNVQKASLYRSCAGSVSREFHVATVVARTSKWFLSFLWDRGPYMWEERADTFSMQVIQRAHTFQERSLEGKVVM